jgi:hypothetical protein
MRHKTSSRWTMIEEADEPEPDGRGPHWRVGFPPEPTPFTNSQGGSTSLLNCC